MKVSVGISNRHVHLKKATADILFGNDYQFTKKNDINQPNQYATLETVTVKTPKNEFKNVRIILPFRDYDQVEISKSDAYYLGVNPPIRQSGDLNNSEIITIIGPKGQVTTQGCIIADRHIHILPKQAKMYELEGIDEVYVNIEGEKGAILKHVKIRISEDAYFELHIDTDDANSNLLKNGDIVEIIKK